MTISLERARNFVYSHGLLWEQALFRYLFEDGSLERVHQSLLCYKNLDGGWGNGLEHDITCPDSHPLALEYLLSIHRDTGLPLTPLLEGTVEWVERHREEDGSLKNPPTLLQYPHAPWWSGGGQTAPDAITGHLMKLGLCTPSLAESTSAWAADNLTLDKIKSNEWLFMAYHAHDYYYNLPHTPEVAPYREATLHNIIECAQKASEKQYFTVFQFAPHPETELAQALPKELLNRFLDYLETAQTEDGGWEDEHGLKHWQPYFTIVILQVLKNYGRW